MLGELRLVSAPTDTNNSNGSDLDELLRQIETWSNENLDKDSIRLSGQFNAVVQLLSSRSKALDQIDVLQDQIHGLNSNITALKASVHKTDLLVNEKRKQLSELIRKTEVSKLSPHQLTLLEEYNKSLRPEPKNVLEWLKERAVRYDVTKDLVLFLFGAPFGVLLDRLWQRCRAGRRRRSKEVRPAQVNAA
jgi:ABC-type transporter Mla subunit MlaD